MLTGDILLFVKVAETLSFKEAAEQLRISRSQASKRIASIEEELGTKLIYRTPRSISLTGAGETLLEHYRRVYGMIEEARLAVENLNRGPAGRLRFSVPTCLGTALLPHLHREFLPRYPDVVLDAHMSETCVDIVAGAYDVVIRVAQKLADSTLTAQRLATSSLAVAASPEYLDRCGTPAHAVELSKHSCLTLGRERQQGGAWQFHTPNGRLSVPVTFSMVCDNNLALVVAACSGLGFVYVPRAVVANELRRGTLREVLPEFCKGISWGVYAVYAGRTPTSNAAAFIEFVRGFLPMLEHVDRWQPVAGPAKPTAPSAAVP